MDVNGIYMIILLLYCIMYTYVYYFYSWRPQKSSLISFQEVHLTSAEIWIALNGDVYDVTKFHRIHPGGSQIILQHAGKAGKAWAMGETGAYSCWLRGSEVGVLMSFADLELFTLMDLSGGGLSSQ